MDTPTAKSKTASLPTTYQCIVCQMTTVSLSKLHRHQTYQHTPEELSLSTIGLQCLFINNIHEANSIVYDNSWLCNPLKQAEFYTVSAKLLNDCNGNINDSAPVDYTIVKNCSIFEEVETNEPTEVANESTESKSFVQQQTAAFQFESDHIFQPAAPPALEPPKNVIQTKESQTVELSEINVTNSEDSAAVPNFPEKNTKATELRVVVTETDPFVNCIEGLCSDLKKIKNRPKKRKMAPKRDPAPRAVKAKAKSRAPRKKAKTSNNALNNNTVILKVDKEATTLTKEDSASADCKESPSKGQETEYPVKENSADEDIVKSQLELPESKAKNQELKTTVNCSTNLDCDARNLKIAETEVACQEDIANGNSSQKPSEVCSTEVPANEDLANAISVATDSEIEEQDIPFEDDFANGNCPEISGLEGVSEAADPPAPFTFPWYPPGINDYSILVLDPEAQQLVWSSVAIVDPQDELENETLQKIPVLPELTAADLQDSDICENAKTSSGSEAKDTEGTDEEPATSVETRPRTNIVLRPRRTAAANLTP